MISRPVVLVIMDGWGVVAPSVGNAITRITRERNDA